jgi:rod shape-determining protein MreC
VRSSFLWRNRVMLSSGALLIFALHMISSHIQPDSRTTKPALVLLEMMRPVQELESGAANQISGVFHDYLDLVGARRENAELHRELAQLQSQGAQLAELEVENRRLSELLELRDALGIKAVAADVIGNDALGLSRTLVISAGSSEGFRRDMAVIVPEGVVGKLIMVAPDAARVLLIDDHNSALDAVDQRSRARGIVAGVIDDGLTMKYVSRSDDVKPGDEIVTSGMDGIFPRGLLVGQVKRVSQQGPGLFLDIEVRQAADLSKLEQVMVLTGKPPQIPLDSPG